MSNKLLVAKNLQKYYPVKQGGFFKKKSTVKALDGVSFELSTGKTLAVVGESGCGKSTLARLISMIETPTAGHFTVEGVDSATGSKESVKSLRRQIQLIFQDPYGSLNPRKKVGSILEEPLIINTDLSKAERREKALAIMEKVGLSAEQYNRYPHMFSGGQRQRIAVARALMLSPKIVVADEPVSALDISVQAQTLNLLMDLQDDLNLSYLFISHDLSVVRLISDDVMVMYLGKTVEHGEKEVIFQNPLHPYTQALLAATPKVNPELRGEKIELTGELPSPLNPPSGCSFHGRCCHAMDICSQHAPELNRVENRLIACHLYNK